MYLWSRDHHLHPSQLAYDKQNQSLKTFPFVPFISQVVAFMNSRVGHTTVLACIGVIVMEGIHTFGELGLG
uniref:Uncharacterized protein n=1 Tax=Naja naja TaxID=35670 RepID=A0A8C7E432_NAJNA